MSKNIAVSVRQRLMNLNRLPGQQQDFQKLLRLYALERLLYRLWFYRILWSSCFPGLRPFMEEAINRLCNQLS